MGGEAAEPFSSPYGYATGVHKEVLFVNRPLIRILLCETSINICVLCVYFLWMLYLLSVAARFNERSFTYLVFVLRNVFVRYCVYQTPCQILGVVFVHVCIKNIFLCTWTEISNNFIPKKCLFSLFESYLH